MANKKLILDVGRQTVLFASISIAFDQIADTGVAVQAINLPYGAQIVGGDVIVDTAFNPGTSLVLDVGDKIVANRYANDVDLKTAARTPLGVTGYVSDGGEIFVTPVLVGAAPTAGALRISVQYVIKGRAGLVQPN